MILTKAERREFLESRRRGIHGSDIAAICGRNPYKDAMDVWLEKVRPVQPSELELEGQNIDIWRGIILEEPLAEVYEYLHDRPIQTFGDNNLKIHGDHDWVRAHLDGRVVSTGNHPFSTTGGWECKAPRQKGFREIVESGLQPYRIFQIQWELFASGYEWASLAVGNLEEARGPLIKWDMRPHEELIEQMYERAKRFWHECVLPREEPDLAEWGQPIRTEMPETEGGERVEIEDPEMVRATFHLMKSYLIRNRAKDNYDEKKAAFKTRMEERDLEKIQVPGLGKVNYGWRSGRTKFDDEKLRDFRPLNPDKVAEHINGLFSEHDFDVGDLADRLIENCEIDYSRFETQYDDYRAFRPYPEADDHTDLPLPDAVLEEAGE